MASTFEETEMAIRIKGSFSFPGKLKFKTIPVGDPTPAEEPLAFITEEGELLIDENGNTLVAEEAQS